MDLIKILIIAVNYNSYGELKSFLQSINNNINKNDKQIEIDVIVADNSTEKEFINDSLFPNISLKVFKLENLGYFGAAFYIINNFINVSQYKYIIISNVDILLENDFISQLLDFKLTSKIGWISPYRYSEKYNIPLYVEREKRIPKWKMLLFLIVYKYSFIQRIQSFFTIRKYKTKNIELSNKKIYSGCGSCFILTSYFFKCYPKITYPIFLYGEEIFIAELLREKQLDAYYVPNIRIKNIGEVSTKHLKRKSFCHYNYEAIKYLYNKFYK